VSDTGVQFGRVAQFGKVSDTFSECGFAGRFAGGGQTRRRAVSDTGVQLGRVAQFAEVSDTFSECGFGGRFAGGVGHGGASGV
jgi:hypothetical protein